MGSVQDQREVEQTASHGLQAQRQPQFHSNELTQPAHLEVALLTGGQDRHYAVGLTLALIEQNINVEVIGSDEVDGPEFRNNPHVRFFNLHGGSQKAGFRRRLVKMLVFYAQLIRYAATAKPKIFHILWNNKLQVFDRTVLMLLYKVLGKQVVLTAHNVNAGRRDKKDSWLNRATLRCQYQLLDHLFVHTEKMRDELVIEFGVNSQKITIIPYPVNNAVPYTELTGEEARQRLGIRQDEKVILFFGAIKQYKGLEYLVAAFLQIAVESNYKLIIAGERKKGSEECWDSIERTIEESPHKDKILQKIEFIPDAEAEIYFKAADVAVLPYTEIFQSGILFMAYSFGLPVIATKVGSFAEDILEGKTGFVCQSRDAASLAATIDGYFDSELFSTLGESRVEIRNSTFATHSWGSVASATKEIYSHLLMPNRLGVG